MVEPDPFKEKGGVPHGLGSLLSMWRHNNPVDNIEEEAVKHDVHLCLLGTKIGPFVGN